MSSLAFTVPVKDLNTSMLHRLVIVPDFVFSSQFFKLPRDYNVRRSKKITTINTQDGEQFLLFSEYLVFSHCRQFMLVLGSDLPHIDIVAAASSVESVGDSCLV